MFRAFFNLSLAAIVVSPVLAQGQDQVQQRFQRFGGGPLVPAELAEKLALSAEQKDKIAKLQADYDKKTEEARAKLQQAFQNKDRDAIRQASEALRGGKAREELEAKVKELLNDEQKKKFDELKAQRRPGLPFQPGAFGRPGGQPGIVLPASIQERLELTAEQKDKLAQLQKEVDGKLDAILTAEQKKKLDELKSGQRPRRPPQ